MNTEIALALIAILASVVNGVVSRFKGRREQHEETEDALRNHLLKQSEELMEMLRSRATVQDKQIADVLSAVNSLTGKISEVDDTLKQFAETQTAVNDCIVSVLDKQELNGNLTLAKHLVSTEKRAFRFAMANT